MSTLMQYSLNSDIATSSHIDLDDSKATCRFFNRHSRYLFAVFDNMSCGKGNQGA
jgi:hypothetical protein